MAKVNYAGVAYQETPKFGKYNHFDVFKVNCITGPESIDQKFVPEDSKDFLKRSKYFLKQCECPAEDSCDPISTCEDFRIVKCYIIHLGETFEEVQKLLERNRPSVPNILSSSDAANISPTKQKKKDIAPKPKTSRTFQKIMQRVKDDSFLNQLIHDDEESEESSTEGGLENLLKGDSALALISTRAKNLRKEKRNYGKVSKRVFIKPLKPKKKKTCKKKTVLNKKASKFRECDICHAKFTNKTAVISHIHSLHQETGDQQELSRNDNGREVINIIDDIPSSITENQLNDNGFTDLRAANMQQENFPENSEEFENDRHNNVNGEVNNKKGLHGREVINIIDDVNSSITENLLTDNGSAATSVSDVSAANMQQENSPENSEKFENDSHNNVNGEVNNKKVHGREVINIIDDLNSSVTENRLNRKGSAATFVSGNTKHSEVINHSRDVSAAKTRQDKYNEIPATFQNASHNNANGELDTLNIEDNRDKHGSSIQLISNSINTSEIRKSKKGGVRNEAGKYVLPRISGNQSSPSTPRRVQNTPKRKKNVISPSSDDSPSLTHSEESDLELDESEGRVQRIRHCKKRLLLRKDDSEIVEKREKRSQDDEILDAWEYYKNENNRTEANGFTRGQIEARNFDGVEQDMVYLGLERWCKNDEWILWQRLAPEEFFSKLVGVFYPKDKLAARCQNLNQVCVQLSDKEIKVLTPQTKRLTISLYDDFLRRRFKSAEDRVNALLQVNKMYTTKIRNTRLQYYKKSNRRHSA